MPENTTPSPLAYRRRIAAEFPDLTMGQVKAAAKKIFWMAENMHEVFDFYEGMKILGIITDTTARDAIRNIEAVAA